MESRSPFSDLIEQSEGLNFTPIGESKAMYTAYTNINQPIWRDVTSPLAAETECTVSKSARKYAGR